MATISQKKPDKELLNQLQSILLKEDRVTIERLQETIDDPVLLSEKVSPIIEERMIFFKENFPKEFQVTVDKMIEKKLKASQEEILDLIYPVMGQMIKKYVNHQIQMVKDTIDDSIKNTFSGQGFLWRLKNSLFGMKVSDQVIHDLKNFHIEEIYLIQRNSVEMIEYGTYKILLQNFYSYYIAIAISGTMSSSEREDLGNELLNFATENLKTLPAEPDGETFKVISTALNKSFIKK